MAEFLPVIIVGSIIGAFAIVFVLAYIAISKEKEQQDDDRHMSDKELVVRLLQYAKPYWKSFVLVFFIMIFSIIYDIVSPLIIGDIQNIVKDDFEKPNFAFGFSFLENYTLQSFLECITLNNSDSSLLRQNTSTQIRKEKQHVRTEEEPCSSC